MEMGGLPFPCFLRDQSAMTLYWDAWLETTIYRDIARFFARAYDPRIILKILRQFKEAALRGEFFSSSLISGIQSRKLNSYLTAMEDTFLIRRISCHDQGVGKDLWVLFDSGLLRHLLSDVRSEGATLSIARTFLFNEISAQREYSGKRLELTYYKSAKGRPVDLILDNIPIQIITQSSLSGIGWQERALAGAMKTLGQTRGIIAAPVDHPIIGKKGISILPWSSWS
jgi:predicted AAA+ superfamily ATPase